MVLHNPNNWHWVDKNCIAWAREYFDNELVGLKASDGTTTAETTPVKTVNGDVEVCQRKGKVISLFDVAIEVGFAGRAGETDVSGVVKIPEVSYDNDEDDFQFEIAIDNDSNDKLPVKSLVRKEIVPQLRKKLAAFGPTLIKTHGGEIQHSGSEKIHWASNAKPGTASKTVVASSSDAKPQSENFFGVSAYNTTSLTLEPRFNAAPEQLYQALLTPQLVAAWSRSPPNVEPKVGGKFSLFGGNVTGKFVELDENKRIKMEWRLRDWKSGHFAVLTHSFVVQDGETVMHTVWEGIPVGEEEQVEQNFNEYYVKPIKLTFGYGIL